MGNPSYINRFIDILRSPLGRPLLNELAASSDKLAALLYFPPAPANPAEAPAPPVSVDTNHHHARPQYSEFVLSTYSTSGLLQPLLN